MRPAAALLFALCAFAQTSRDPYRDAYRVWRETDPNLEAQAGAASPAALKQRSGVLAQQAAKFSQARRDFFSAMFTATEEHGAWLRNTAKPDDTAGNSSQEVKAFITRTDQALGRTIAAFAGDPDRGIQQVRQALERERAALRAVSSGVDVTSKAESVAVSSQAAIETIRLKLIDGVRDLNAQFKQAGDAETAEASQWSAYYQKLGEAAPAVVTSSATPAEPPHAEPLERPTISPLSPAVKFSGEWIFPPLDGSYHGAKPESATLVVNAEGARLSGSLTARFKLPAGSGDPNVKFNFSGDTREARSQLLPIVAAGGVSGTIELIPGGAFNLVEVYFRIQGNSGVHEGNMILLKQ